MIERIGTQALWVLLIVWGYFIAKYCLRFYVPALLNTAVIIVGIASGIAVALWLFRQSKAL